MRPSIRDALTCLVLGPPFVVVCVLVVRRGLLYPRPEPLAEPTLARSAVPPTQTTASTCTKE